MSGKRLIDANALIRHICFRCEDGDGEGACAQLCKFITAIDATPTIDAVEVVRCRECVFRYCAGLCPMCWYVSAMDEMRVIDITEDDGFCHKGAKIDGGSDDA